MGPERKKAQGPGEEVTPGHWPCLANPFLSHLPLQERSSADQHSAEEDGERRLIGANAGRNVHGWSPGQFSQHGGTLCKRDWPLRDGTACHGRRPSSLVLL